MRALNQHRISRCNTPQRLLLLTLLSIAVISSVIVYSQSFLESISRSRLAYLPGIDFTAYEPSVRLDNEFKPTVVSWRLNTRSGGITQWATQMQAQIIGFTPYIGRHAYATGYDAAQWLTQAPPTLDALIAQGGETLSELASSLDKNAVDLLLSPSLDRVDYLEEHWAQAQNNIEGSATLFFLSRSLEQAIAVNHRTDNLRFALEKPVSMQPEVFAGLIEKAKVIIRDQQSNISLMVAIDGESLDDRGLSDPQREAIQQYADGIILNASVDWQTKQYPRLEKTLREAKAMFPSKRLLLRIPISRYDAKSESFEYITAKTLTGAVASATQFAEGHLIFDDTGLLLFRGLFGEDQAPPVDYGVLKRLVQELH